MKIMQHNSYKYLDINLDPTLEKLKNFKMSEKREFNDFLSDTSSFLYDLFEGISKLKKPPVDNYTIIKSKIMLIYPKLNKLHQKLSYLDFDSKCMDRLMHVLSHTLDDMDIILKKNEKIRD